MSFLGRQYEESLDPDSPSVAYLSGEIIRWFSILSLLNGFNLAPLAIFFYMKSVVWWL